MSENPAHEKAKEIMESMKIHHKIKPLPKCDRCGSQLRKKKKKKSFCICGEEQK